MTLRRITQELTNLRNDPHPTISATPITDKNLHHWTATITGPAGSPYANTTFSLNIFLPETYPRIPPKVVFHTPIFHPNVSNRGEVKMPEFEAEQWSPVITIRTLLISVQAMLSDVNLEDGCVGNEEAARLWRKDVGEFEIKARQWIMLQETEGRAG
jgi:ubiquitin-protein ligase